MSPPRDFLSSDREFSRELRFYIDARQIFWRRFDLPSTRFYCVVSLCKAFYLFSRFFRSPDSQSREVTVAGNFAPLKLFSSSRDFVFVRSNFRFPLKKKRGFHKIQHFSWFSRSEIKIASSGNDSIAWETRPMARDRKTERNTLISH